MTGEIVYYTMCSGCTILLPYVYGVNIDAVFSNQLPLLSNYQVLHALQQISRPKAVECV